jgi:hypothetical protein
VLQRVLGPCSDAIGNRREAVLTSAGKLQIQ